MIIVILILAAILFIYFNVIPGKGHTIISWLSLIVTSLCILGIVAHDYNHWGMKTETQISKQSLVSSATPNLPLLLYQPLNRLAFFCPCFFQKFKQHCFVSRHDRSFLYCSLYCHLLIIFLTAGDAIFYQHRNISLCF